MLLEKRIRGISSMVALLALSLGLVWFLISYGVVFHAPFGLALRTAAPLDSYFMVASLVILGFFVDYLRTSEMRLHHLERSNAWIFAILAAVQQCFTVLLVMTIYMVFSKDLSVSRLFILVFMVGLLPVLTLVHRYLPGWLSETLFGGRYRYNAVVVTASPNGQDRVRAWLGRHGSYGVNIQETVNVQDLGAGIVGDVKEMVADITATLKQLRPSLVIMHQFPVDSVALLSLKKLCDRIGCRMLMALDLEPELAPAISFHKDEDMQLISIRHEPLECPSNRLVKRFLDIAISLPVVAFVMPPLTLWVWLMQRKQSPGPIFHRQMRSGLQNEHFVLYKFRSMHVGHGQENRQASREDDRIFSFGKFIRKASLDEIPQFINVLVGDMSVVGPRPHLPQHDEDFAKVVETYPIRHLVKPGITGLAQVKGHRGEVRDPRQLSDRVKSDVFYIEHWSFGLDINIVFKTAFQLFRAPETAY